MRALLENHEGLDPAFPARVFFNEFNRDSLNLRIIYWYHPPNYWDFLAFSQRLNLEIKRRFAAADIEFALPATSAVIRQQDDEPLDLRVLGRPEGVDPA